ncbi:MAG: hypothetical protein ABR530_09895 [Pyrinomonadaceae bacterium]
MHCPSCGQQQVSTQTKFCSRCGMPLSIVAEVLVHGGYLPQLAAINQKTTLLNRRNGVAFSLLWCLFFLLIMAPLWGIMDVEELVAASAVIGIFGGLMFLVSSLIFLPKRPMIPPIPEAFTHNPQAAVPAQSGYPALPPQQSVPASFYGQPQSGNWRDTNDLQPNSVTEGTTKLLEKDESP